MAVDGDIKFTPTFIRVTDSIIVCFIIFNVYYLSLLSRMLIECHTSFISTYVIYIIRVYIL